MRKIQFHTKQTVASFDVWTEELVVFECDRANDDGLMRLEELPFQRIQLRTYGHRYTRGVLQ